MKAKVWTGYSAIKLLPRVMLYCLCSMVSLWTLSSLAWAHGGEGHSHAEEAPMLIAAQPGAPRIETRSEQVELLGVYEKGRLTLYIDDFASNAPIAGLAIEVSADANAVKAVEKVAGQYEVSLPWVQAPGHYPLTFLLEGDAVTDLLQATLDIPMTTVAPVATPAHRLTNFYWLVAAGGAAFLLLIWSVARSRRRSIAVVGLACVLAFWRESPAYAHGGEEHSHEDTTVTAPVGDTPRRLPDGSVFIPKATQHLLQVRTQVAKEEASVRRVTLNGRVIADPAASGVVQAAQTGRIVAGTNGLPVLGQAVKAGQVLAWLEPVTSSLERGNQQAALVALDSELRIAEQRRARLESLVGSVPRKDIEAAQIEAESLLKRRAAVAASIDQKVPLTSPVAGVISASEFVVGQVVSAGDLLFTIVQPERLWVEALSYDPALVLGDAPAVAQVGSQSVTLTRVGSGAVLRDQSIPLHFRMQPPVPPMPIGQPVTVLVSTQTPVRGVPVPVDALARNAQGEWVVWLHEKAELFRAVGVQSEPLDGNRVMVTQGLAPGARIVISGAASLGQIR